MRFASNQQPEPALMQCSKHRRRAEAVAATAQVRFTAADGPLSGAYPQAPHRQAVARVTFWGVDADHRLNLN
jgi:hypothetical protein